MLFGFFIRTNKIFRLPNKRYPLKSFYQFCSVQSNIYPHIIPQVDQVIPQIISLNENLNNTPLFVAGKIDSDNKVNIYDPSVDEDTSFCLVFYPNPQDPPLNIDDTHKRIINEYWSCIKPMFICRDMSGYYLGTAEDSNIMLFKKTGWNESDGYICKIKSGYNESTMQTNESPEFDDVPIYLKKVNREVLKYK